MPDLAKPAKVGLGTAPVFLTAISTILGAILFLRFGYAVGNVGFWGSVVIILLGHLVTIPTSMAIAEIATNQKVEGGGEYYIISRSFGLSIGGTIGIALYLSQAISVAFYIIAFGEAVVPVLHWLEDTLGISSIDSRFVTLPVLGLFGLLLLTKGIGSGVKVLYFVVFILFLALVSFFLGDSGYSANQTVDLFKTRVQNPDSFFIVFAIIFPAFTGMTAGVGLSGDLKQPRKSIPLGTISATILGMLMYVIIAYKLIYSASPDDLVNDQLVMAKIAIWGPMISIGLAAATLSSALGSILVAPRTLQALGNDKISPFFKVNKWLAHGKKGSNEPTNGTLITLLLASLVIVLGDIDFVAKIISMFFMITYGSLCLISFLQHFASSPSYRPTFRSRWYISLLGAIMCIWLMFKMSTPYAVFAIITILVIYQVISRYKTKEKSISSLIQGSIFQLSRTIQIFLQRRNKGDQESEWRPSVVSISDQSFENLDQFNLLRWISEKYGFGTHMHLIHGYLSHKSAEEIDNSMDRLMKIGEAVGSNVFLKPIVCPSYTSALAQAIQLPGVSGKENNMVLFSYFRRDPEALEQIIENFGLAESMNFDVAILSTTERGFGLKRDIHLWINPDDQRTANLIILLGFIISGHPDWKKAQIKVFTIYDAEEMDQQKQALNELIEEGRLPISLKNIHVLTRTEDRSYRSIINEHSETCDLAIVGIRSEILKKQKDEIFNGYERLGNMLFVNSSSSINLQ